MTCCYTKPSSRRDNNVGTVRRTRRAGDYGLACWNCSKNPMDELQLQIPPAPGEAKFDAPGGFLFVNWEKSSGRRLSAGGDS